MSLRFEVKNVKVHFKTVPNLVLPSQTLSLCTHHSNFVSLRHTPYAFVIFAKSGHVNVSGIETFEDIKNIVPVVKHQLGVDIHPDNIKIDNSTASGKLQSNNFHLLDLQSRAASLGVLVSIRPHFFPSALIRQKKRLSTRGKGTIILFQNGKFIIVGCRSLSTIEDTYNQLCAITAKQ